MSDLNIKYFLLFLVIGSGCFFSCKKDTIEINWEELNLPTSDDLSAVYFTDAMTGHAVGGDTWYGGIYLQTKDGGATWTVDTFSNKHLYGLHFNANGIGNAVGIDGYLFNTKDVGFEQWNFHRTPRYDILRDVCFNSRNEGVVVGGVGFAKGVIMTIDTNYLVPEVDTFENELRTVVYSDDNTIHVAGYGLIMRSTDKGASWTETTVTGDFYQSMVFPSPATGYIVGYNGSILKTVDHGASWQHLRNGDALSVSDEPFKAVYFENETEGYIVGEKGVCWRTKNGGESWQIIGGLPGFDFQDVFVLEGYVYIVGKNGRMIRLED